MANRTPTPARVQREEVRPQPPKTVDERLAVLDEKLGQILEAMKRHRAQIEALAGGVFVERARSAAELDKASQ